MSWFNTMMKTKVGIDVQWQEDHCQTHCFLCAHLVLPTVQFLLSFLSQQGANRIS
jgi:hypothetical protein